MATVSARGVKASANEVVIVMGAGVGCIALLYWLAKREVTGAASAVADAAAPVINAVNPASQTNAVNSLLTAGYRVVSPKAVQQDLTISTALNDGLDTLRGWLGGDSPYDPNN